MFRKRILANIIDLMMFWIPLFSFACVYMILIEKGSSPSLIRTMEDILFFITDYLPCYLILKDVIFRDSIGKRIVHITVKNTRGGKPNLFQLFIRNITYYIWPVEAGLLLLGKRRLGDILAKTEVVAKV